MEPAKLPDRTGSASVASGRLLLFARGLSYLDRVSLKIVFSGAEYDSVEAMPPDVRAQYEKVLESLKQTGGDEVLSALQRVSSGTRPGRPSAGALRPPPVVEEDHRSSGGLLRILLWMALGAAIALWLARRG